MCYGPIQLEDPMKIDVERFDKKQMEYLKKYKLHFVQVEGLVIEQYFYNDSFTLDSIKYWDNFEKPEYTGSEYFQYNKEHQLTYHSLNEIGPMGYLSKQVSSIFYENGMVQKYERVLSQWDDTKNNTLMYTDTIFTIELLEHNDTLTTYNRKSNHRLSSTLFYENQRLIKEKSGSRLVTAKVIKNKSGYEIKFTQNEGAFYLPYSEFYDSNNALLYSMTSESNYYEQRTYNHKGELLRIEFFKTCGRDYSLNSFIRRPWDGLIEKEIVAYASDYPEKNGINTYLKTYEYLKEIPK